MSSLDRMISLMHPYTETNKMFIRPSIQYSDPEESREHSFLRYIGKRVLENNDNFTCAITGQTGKGKSWVSGAMAEIYSEMFGINYDVNKHMFFKMKDLLMLINYPERYDIQPGSIIQYDEVQTEANARNWQSMSNKILNGLMSTFRNKRLVIFFPTPSFYALDKQTRELLKGEIKVLGFNKDTKMTRVKPRIIIDYNYRLDKPIAPMLKVKYPGGFYHLNEWKIPSPSKEWIKAYEKKKAEFSVDHNKKLLNQFMHMEQKHNKTEATANPRRNFDIIREAYQNNKSFDEICSLVPHISPQTVEKNIYLVKKAMSSLPVAS